MQTDDAGSDDRSWRRHVALGALYMFAGGALGVAFAFIPSHAVGPASDLGIAILFGTIGALAGAAVGLGAAYIERRDVEDSQGEST